MVERDVDLVMVECDVGLLEGTVLRVSASAFGGEVSWVEGTVLPLSVGAFEREVGLANVTLLLESGFAVLCEVDMDESGFAVGDVDLEADDDGCTVLGASGRALTWDTDDPG